MSSRQVDAVRHRRRPRDDGRARRQQGGHAADGASRPTPSTSRTSRWCTRPTGRRRPPTTWSWRTATARRCCTAWAGGRRPERDHRHLPGVRHHPAALRAHRRHRPGPVLPAGPALLLRGDHGMTDLLPVTRIPRIRPPATRRRRRGPVPRGAGGEAARRPGRGRLGAGVPDVPRLLAGRRGARLLARGGGAGRDLLVPGARRRRGAARSCGWAPPARCSRASATAT